MSVSYTLAEAAAVVEARLIGAGARFQGVSTDSRRIVPGTLFIALRGPRFDGHQYVDAALACGAVAALVERQRLGQGPLLLVDDTVQALGRLAAAWRAAHRLVLVAVTGSVGKTTVKEMIASILSRGGGLLATRGNLNNHLGVPLTLLELDASHRVAVIEMGANHPGEIATLTRIAAPTVALITNAGPVHLEGFGSVAGVARAKGEIIAGLGPGGCAVINQDDRHAALWHELAADRRRLTFALEADADVTTDPSAIEYLEGDRPSTRFPLATPLGTLTVRLPLAGRHNVANAIAAAAGALAGGATLENVRQGLAAVGPIPGRLQGRRGIAGCCLVDDSYNANPAAFDAAIEFLAGRPGRRWLAVGEMGELGDEARRWHAWVGGRARARGIDRLLAIGEMAGEAATAFGSGGAVFDTPQQLVDAIRGELAADVTLLVKGSRMARMERVTEALAADAAGGTG